MYLKNLKRRSGLATIISIYLKTVNVLFVVYQYLKYLNSREKPMNKNDKKAILIIINVFEHMAKRNRKCYNDFAEIIERLHRMI